MSVCIKVLNIMARDTRRYSTGRQTPVQKEGSKSDDRVC